ncbi:MAG: hypothetical protein QXH42_01610 [Thermoplasmata archaeon]
MPVCKLCGQRIDLSRTGIRARRCGSCGAVVCDEHYSRERGLCSPCAGLPVRIKRRSFIRKRRVEP